VKHHFLAVNSCLTVVIIRHTNCELE